MAGAPIRTVTIMSDAVWYVCISISWEIYYHTSQECTRLKHVLSSCIRPLQFRKPHVLWSEERLQSTPLVHCVQSYATALPLLPTYYAEVLLARRHRCFRNALRYCGVTAPYISSAQPKGARPLVAPYHSLVNMNRTCMWDRMILMLMFTTGGMKTCCSGCRH